MAWDEHPDSGWRRRQVLAASAAVLGGGLLEPAGLRRGDGVDGHVDHRER